MINPYYFTNRVLNVAYEFKPDSHHINLLNSKITAKPNSLEIKKFLVKDKIEYMCTKCAGIKNQYKFKYQTVFSAKLYEQDEGDQVLD